MFIKYPADSLVSVVKLHHNLNPEEIYTLNHPKILKKYINKKTIPTQIKIKKNIMEKWCRYINNQIDKIHKYIDVGKLIGYEMSKLKSIDIDSMDDFRLASIIQKNLNLIIKHDKKKDIFFLKLI